MNAEIRSALYPFVECFDSFLGINYVIRTLFLASCFLVIFTIYPESIYIRVYPQDIYGFLDGIHRMVSGQVPHRDFSSHLGIMVYALPSLFVRLGADPMLSLGYAQAALLILDFVVLVHLIKTRLPGMPGLLFGLWTLLMLAARMNLGDDPQYITLAMNYNRYCTIFLCQLLIFFISPDSKNRWIMAMDVMIMSGLTLILFYSKMTYFAVALTALTLLLWTSRANATRVIAAVAISVTVVIGLELVYEFHRGYFADLLIAAQMSGDVRGGYYTMLVAIQKNFLELALCVILPSIILYRMRAVRRIDWVIFPFVTVASLLLLNQNAQDRVLAVPFILLLLALDSINRRIESRSGKVELIGFIYAAMVLMCFVYSYPLVVNCATSFVKSVSGGAPIGTERITKGLLIDWRNADPLLSHDIVVGAESPFDLFERARASATNNPGMPLSEAEYAVSLQDGLKAARDGCRVNARILTADYVNPFPVILDLPVGGRMIYIDTERTISTSSYPPPDQMFKDITCVMYPKMPISYDSRQIFRTIYGQYVKDNFYIANESEYWTVYTIKHIPNL